MIENLQVKIWILIFQNQIKNIILTIQKSNGKIGDRKIILNLIIIHK